MNDYVMQNVTAPAPIPVGYHTVTPFLIVDGAEKLTQFMKAAFNAEIIHVMREPSGKVMHGVAKIGDSMLMLSDTNEKMGAMPSMLYLYVEDVDKVYKQAIRAGGQSLREPRDEFYGDRSGGIQDAWGNQWWVATHVEDVSMEEIQRRSEAFYNKK